ncbi:hypothetical protein [Actinoplanes sp. NPDC026623]|uniref:hypothetical protein n=1 Tax=Actinoplanes sp. NPDC026623 TaxID=3155610 RepID=UPI003408E677
MPRAWFRWSIWCSIRPSSERSRSASHGAGDFELVALGRILLGNPAWVTLAATGRLDEIHDYRKADEDTYF